MIRIVVVDDHDIVRKGVISYLETEDNFDVVGEASSGNEGVKVVLAEKPDVVLMDLIMEDGTGMEATKEIKANLPNCKVIILTSYYDDAQVFPVLEAGAFSYLLKTASADEIVNAITKAYQGENVIEPKVAHKVMNRFQSKQEKPHDSLTERELEVLICVAEGASNQEIADQLFIGVKTVKTHVSNILRKLDVHDRTQAAVYAHRNQLLRDLSS
ncbi:NarL family two-component system response regulator LiaR [Natronobacillus azotifigens]|uniref:Response regulator transcription factor n=1 Tax=Natronobacillus azotifigens TaxID=472978 RepID=A0A9J6RD72_9BACI|nr:response regulator transcription factor [Natronobacillus azotifigens]MCZ0703299.1 response regulator transcription factor [Natronobacillus azotifigens]